MEITFLSDTHNRHNEIHLPGGDMLIHSGDATGRGTDHEVDRFLQWFAQQDYKHKIFVPGNHDLIIEALPDEFTHQAKCLDIHLLIDRSVTIEGINIHGSPVTPWFCDWAWNRARTTAEALLHNCDYIFPHWDLIPLDTDILVTHGPPYGTLDELQRGGLVGCEDLAERIKEVKPKIHAFGHIHCAQGVEEKDGTIYINAANLNEMYHYSHKPKMVNWNNGKPKLI